MSRFRVLVEELRRRHVFRVAAAYAVVGWVVVEVSSTVAPLLLLPEWVPRAIVVLVILGFPVAVVLAWAYDITPDGVEPTGAEAPVAPEAPRRGPVAPAAGVAAALLVLAAAGVVGWILVRGGSDSGDPALQGDELLARVDSLVDQRRFTEAFGLVSRAEVGGETVPSTVRARVSDRLTVLTDPPEATVSARRFDDAESNGMPTESWDELGTTPLRGLDLARGDYFIRMEREGFASVERLVSSSDARAGPPPDQVPEVLLRVPMFPVDSIPEEMVFVPGGAYSVVSRNLQGLLANLDDYFLDRFEVTNDDFAEFVREGGYRDREHWTALLGDPAAPEADEALRGFVDRTGLPGPRPWQGQSVPDDRGEHPVTGVTWYEAAAYCRYRGGRLPTLFEWEKAARDGQVSSFGVRMPWGTLTSAPGGRTRANFNGEGTSPVGAHPFGLSPYGAYDMAGNVKEWLLNPTETGRAVTGGSWEDPIYLFTEVGGMEPLSVSDALGFRCARGREEGSESPSGTSATALRVAPETPEYDPVGDAAFAGLLSHYAYDRRPVDAELTERAEGPGWVRERLVYDGPDDSRVIAYLYLPTGTEPPYQTLAFVPGSDVFYGVGVPDAAEWLLAPVIRSGRALFAVVMDGMTERPLPPGTEFPDPPTAGFRNLMVRHATELRLGLDYLETRDDIDGEAFGYVGFSWGAGSRLGFAAVDERFKAVIFVGGGIDERVQPTLPEAANVNFAPRIAAPTLLLNGSEDEEHPWPTRGLPLWNLLTEPKELVLVEGAGHAPPLSARIPPILDFLDRTLGPVTP